MEADATFRRLLRRVELLESALIDAGDDAERRRLRDELIEMHRRLDTAQDELVDATGSEPRISVSSEDPLKSPATQQESTFLDAVAVCLLDKPFDFAGRCGRREYWWFVVFVVLANSFFAVIVYPRVAAGDLPGLANPVLLVTGVVLVLWLLVAHLAAAVRRLHDTGRSGHMIWISFLPVVGVPVLIVLLAQRGDPGSMEQQQGPALT